MLSDFVCEDANLFANRNAIEMPNSKNKRLHHARSDIPAHDSYALKCNVFTRIYLKQRRTCTAQKDTNDTHVLHIAYNEVTTNTTAAAAYDTEESSIATQFELCS